MLWKGQYPQIIHGIVTKWPCYQSKSWSVVELKRRFGPQLVTCGMQANNDQEAVLIKLQDYIQQHLTAVDHHDLVKSDKLFKLPYIFDPSFDFDCPELLTDYEVPSVFAAQDALQHLPSDYKPDYRWFILGGQGSGSPLHVDPCHTSAWNAVVEGRKLWVLMHPDIAKVVPHFSTQDIQTLIHSLIDRELLSSGILHGNKAIERHHLRSIQQGLLQFLLSDTNQDTNKEMQSCKENNGISILIQQAGEILHVPSGWYHAALNLTTSVAVTHNFVEHVHVENFLQAYYNEAKDKFEEKVWEDIRRSVRSFRGVIK